jgi:hypothetical protein
LEGNTINLAVRFMLEMSGLVTLGVWGWAKGDGVLKYVLALVVPLIAAAICGEYLQSQMTQAGQVMHRLLCQA